METYEGRKCSICGSQISDDNPDGIGFGCRANVVQPARKDTFYQFNALKFWVMKVERYKTVFVELFKDTKFRSDFRKNFFESISKAERISKKQLAIIEDWIMQKDFNRYEEINGAVKEDFRFLWNGWTEQSNEEKEYFQERIQFHAKQYLSKRGKIQQEA